eukprot:TRINITY_DN3429_c0_g1_i8.p3 TRINITY_DN3429_c0_g1~~TRINITY_DN3429_c0_g1_i8.p3  ORF type:complete len:135 (+),score=13.39 TRINITY_DN3429_c0_g1_i8:397-801(+)
MGNPWNWSGRTPGGDTVLRAELYALVTCLETLPRHLNLEIRSDSLLVTAGTKQLAVWETNAWYMSARLAIKVPNIDLWLRLREAALARPGRVRVCKVKSRPSTADTERGECSPLDAWGNGWADSLSRDQVPQPK